MPANQGKLKVAGEKNFRNFPDYVKINVPDRSVVFVPMNDYVVIDNQGSNDFIYLESFGAGSCVNIAIRGKERTLLAHMPTDSNHGQGTRAGQGQHEILSTMLELVSRDPSQIEAIGLTGGQGFKAGRTTLTREVLDDLLSRERLTCEINTLGTSEMIVNIKTGEIYALNQQSEDKKFINTSGGQFDGYPSGTEHGKIMQLLSSENEDMPGWSDTHNSDIPEASGSGWNDGNENDEQNDTAENTELPGESGNTGAGGMMEEPVTEGI